MFDFSSFLPCSPCSHMVKVADKLRGGSALSCSHGVHPPALPPAPALLCPPHPTPPRPRVPRHLTQAPHTPPLPAGSSNAKAKPSEFEPNRKNRLGFHLTYRKGMFSNGWPPPARPRRHGGPHGQAARRAGRLAAGVGQAPRHGGPPEGAAARGAPPHPPPLPPYPIPDPSPSSTSSQTPPPTHSTTPSKSMGTQPSWERAA
jgi:hypothetical protein